MTSKAIIAKIVNYDEEDIVIAYAFGSVRLYSS